MEILRLTFQIIGVIVSVIAIVGWMLYFFFRKKIVVEILYEDDDYGEEEFIEQLLKELP